MREAPNGGGREGARVIVKHEHMLVGILRQKVFRTVVSVVVLYDGVAERGRARQSIWVVERVALGNEQIVGRVCG